MPWQQEVFDIGLEVDADGMPFYREVVITIPRQNGKSIVTFGWRLDRCISWGSPQRVAYTAQTGWDARKKLLEDEVPILQGSRLWSAVQKVHRAQGAESVTFKNGSRIDVLASSASAGHGRTLDLGVIDEAFSDADDRREQAILPAMVTKADAQLLVVSTAGTEDSFYLRRKVEAGRAAAESDSGGGICYFEWSAPDDADIDDPDVWAACMPALGHTISVAAIEHARRTMQPDEFRRAYLNQWTVTENRVIPSDVWDQAVARGVELDGPVVFAVDCTPQRNSGTIAAADTHGAVEVVEHDRGTGWIPGRLIDLARRWGARVVLDTHGPAAVFVEELRMAGIQVVDISGREFSLGCASFFAGLHDGLVKVRSHHALDAAAGAVQKRQQGDLWAWARKSTSVDISPIVAATLAWVAARSKPDGGVAFFG